MAQFISLDSRLISGIGVFRFPQDVENVRYIRVLFDVVRQVEEPFESFKYTPKRSRYATITFLRDGYVIQEEPLDYKRRGFDFVSDISGQTLIATKCAYKGTLQSFANLATALGLTVVSVIDLIKDFENLDLFWDEINITCEGSTAVEVKVGYLQYDFCPGSDDTFDPPPPPPPPAEVPPGTPINDISPPYENDDKTEPNELDQPAPPIEYPVGNECELVTVTFSYRTDITQPELVTLSRQCYGPVNDVYIIAPGTSVPTQPWNVSADCRGFFPGGNCQPQGSYVIGPGGTDTILEFTVISVVPS